MPLEKYRIVSQTGRLVLASLLGLFLSAPSARSQTTADSAYYARKQTFGILTAYSNDSSRMLLGIADRRKLFDVGISYNRRILYGRDANWQYSAELLPVALESDPLGRSVTVQTAPAASTTVYSGGPYLSCALLVRPYTYTNEGVTYSGTSYDFCHGRQWTIGTAMSPAGFQLNFLTAHALQPFLVGHGGYMYSTRAIPEAFAGSFNFTFDFGAGVEVYRTRSQSIRAEYRYHHISNHGTALENPGIDNGLFQLTYTFGH